MMKKRDGILTGLLIAVCAACAILAASCSQSSQTPVGFTPGRTTATVIAVVGLISSIIGGLSFARSAGLIGNGSGRNGAIIALVVGLISLILSIVHLGSSSTGGFGTGGGRAGAIVALVLALIGMILGGLVLVRSRRTS